MLKKFRHFGRFFVDEEKQPDVNFTQQEIIFDGKVLQLMRASNDDVANLLLLEGKVYSGVLPWDAYSFQSELQKQNTLYIVVYAAKEIVAFIGMRFSSLEAHITNIAVAPVWQNHGLGTYLLKLLLQRAQDGGSKWVSLEVRADNLGAQRLYRSLGFKATELQENYYQDTNTAGLRMVLRLKSTLSKER